jgi:hypothetical protein
MASDEWRLLRFHKSNPEAHERMRELLKRVYFFVDELDSGADPNMLAQHILTHFTADLPLLFGLGVIHDDRLVGHLLIQFEEYYGCRNMTILQYQLDEAPPRAFHRESFEELIEIGGYANARNMVAVCQDEKVERLHKIFHGMKRYATLMTLDLEEHKNSKQLEEVANG